MSGTRSPRGGRATKFPAATTDWTREIVAARGRDVVKARRRVLRRGDGEAIHDLRVATRRLQATLEIVGGRLPDRPRRRLDRRARTLRRRLGTARNTWVLLGLLGEFRSVPGREERKFVAGLARRLARAAGARPSQERRSLPGIRKRIRTLLREIAHSSPGSAAPAGDAMGGLVRAVLRARAETRGGDPEAMHRLRIAIKRYRYALEALTEAGAPGLRPAIQAARSLQSDLGSLHDLDVLIEVVRRNAHLPGAGGFLSHLQRRRHRQAEKSLRRLARIRPVFAAPTGSGDRPGRVVARRGSPPRQAQTGWTAA